MTTKISTVNAEQFRDAVFFSMTVRRWGNRAQIKDMSALDAYRALRNGKVAGGSVESSGSDKNVKITKILVRSAKLDSINEFLSVTKDRLCGRFGKALPSKVKEGLFVVSKALVQEFEDDLRAAVSKLADLVEDFTANDYENAINRARLNDVNAEEDPGLGPLWNAKDYPTADRLAKTFGLEWQWLALGVPEDLPAALRAEAAEKLEKQMTEAATEVRSALYSQLGEFLDHLVDKLTPGQDGKAKIFRDSLIENVQSFCACFDARNFLRDDTLAAIVAKARAVLDGVTADKVRKYESVKENTRQAFTAIKAELDKAIETMPGRIFDLDE